KKSIRYYQTKRATLQEELRRPSLLRLTDEQKRKGIGIFDARIEKRIAQILAVQKSLPAHEDYDRYRVTGSNWTGATYAVNEDHRQNARVTSFTNSQRKEIAEGLRRSIATIEQQNRALKANQAPADEILKNDALLAERREQLASALTAAPTTTRMIGQKEALDLDKALQLAIAELRRDFTVLFTRYSTYLHELAALNQTRNALAAAQSKPS
ncbi:MAG TPA: hypothetical protein VFV83_08130, partial [Chthoniobacteraceae bacterium]|nr:hypothetical protein [Chthoniobacteraceae bacterium]